MDRGSLRHQYNPKDDKIEHSPAKTDLWVLADEKLDMSQ